MAYTVMVYASAPTSKHLNENHSTFNEDLFCHLSRPSSLHSPPPVFFHHCYIPDNRILLRMAL